MDPLNTIRIALQAQWRNRFRALLTMLGIIIGVGSVIAMMAVGQGSKDSIQQEIAKMGSNVIIVRPGQGMFMGARGGAGAVQTLTLKDAAAMKEQCRYVTGVSPQVTGNGQAVRTGANWPTQIYGVDTDYFSIKQLDVTQGSLLDAEDVRSGAKVCLLGKTVVDNLFPDGGNPVGAIIRFGRIPFKVKGVLEEKGESGFGQDQDDLIVAPYTTVQKRILASTHLGAVYASAAGEDDVDGAVDEISALLRTRHGITTGEDDDFNVRSQKEMLEMFSSTTDLMTVLLASIAGISLVVGGVGIMNIMYVSVTERTREIGIRMAVGARGSDIMLQFLVEAVMLSVAGGIIGLAAGFGASWCITLIAGWATRVTAASVALSFLFCTGTGVFFGWYPSLKASRLDPILALRYE